MISPPLPEPVSVCLWFPLSSVHVQTISRAATDVPQWAVLF